MQAGSIRYKTVSPGCQVRIAPIDAGSPQERLLAFEQKRRKPSAGLVVDSHDDFEIGSHVILDLKFPGQPFTYRSVGTVSWAVPGDPGGPERKLGVLVYGMDKLDEQGISVSMAPASPFATPAPPPPLKRPSREPAAPEPEALPPRERTNRPRPPLASVTAPYPARRTPSSPGTRGTQGYRHEGPSERDPAREDAPTGSFSAELVSLCAVDLKIAGWLGATASTAPAHPTQAPAQSLHELRDSLPRHMLEEEKPLTRSLRPPQPTSLSPAPVSPFPPARSTAPPPAWTTAQTDTESVPKKAPPVVDPRAVQASPTVSLGVSMRSPAKPYRRKSDIPVVELDIDLEVDLELNAEEAMMQAFEQIHELYGCPDATSAARFALDLSCRLVRCRGGICGLVAQDCYEIEIVCASGEVDEAAIPRRLPMSSSLLGHAVRTGENVYASNPAQDPMFDPEYDALVPNMENAVSVPLHREGYTMGALELVGSPRLSGFVAAETNVVAYIAMALAEFLEARQNATGDPTDDAF